MSDFVIFSIGLVIFFITVFGAVMAGGLTLARHRLREEAELAEPVDDDAIEEPLMSRVEY